MSEISFPQESAAPKPKKTPKYRRMEENLASKEELVDKVRSFAANCQIQYEDQAERRDFLDKAKKADRMTRCSRKRDTADRQYQDTQSNVASTMFIRRLNVITSIENTLYFPKNGEIPVEYQPYTGQDEYTSDEGREIADAHNMLLAYAFEVDKMQPKIEDAVYFLNKYGQQALAVEWDYRTERRRKREIAERHMPDYDLGTMTETLGRPKSWRITEKDYVVANNPTIRIIDFDHLYTNARIDSMEMQICINERGFSTLSDAYQMQRDGHYENVGKLSASQLYTGYKTQDALQDRQDNADEGSSDQDQSSLLERWDCWVRVPINEDGEWDEENTIPTWHWATFFGNLHSKAVCTRLIRNPYFHGKTPYLFAHSHRDDKGLFHMSLADIAESLYEEHNTCINQYFDNKTLQNKKPFLIQKGNVYTTDIGADGNKVIHVKNLDSIKEMEIKDTTQTTANAIDRIERDLDKAFGTENSILGQAYGSRTSASEAQTATTNAMKPLLDKARYQGNQIFPWMAEMIMELWRQYSDPKTTITLLNGNQPKEIKPAELWGSLKTKLVAIEKFEDDVTRRAEQNNFMQVALPYLQPICGNKGLANFFRQVMRDRSILDDVDSMFPANNSFDSQHVAESENQAIYFNGVDDYPNEGEDHEIHLKNHKSFRELLKTLPPEQVNKENLAKIDQHILMHEEMLQQSQAPAGELTPAVEPAQQEQVPGAGEQPTLSGEVSGDTLSGLQGGL